MFQNRFQSYLNVSDEQTSDVLYIYTLSLHNTLKNLSANTKPSVHNSSKLFCMRVNHRHKKNGNFLNSKILTKIRRPHKRGDTN